MQSPTLLDSYLAWTLCVRQSSQNCSTVAWSAIKANQSTDSAARDWKSTRNLLENSVVSLVGLHAPSIYAQPSSGSPPSLRAKLHSAVFLAQGLCSWTSQRASLVTTCLWCHDYYWRELVLTLWWSRSWAQFDRPDSVLPPECAVSSHASSKLIRRAFVSSKSSVFGSRLSQK